MGLAIGFATEFWTLWEIDVEKTYTTDAYGRHWHTGNKVIRTYIKNISTDLNKAIALHPNVPVNEDLRGHTRSWSSSESIDRPANIMWFGKYTGQDIAEIAKTDLPYLLWALENANDGRLKAAIAELPEVIAELAKRADEKTRFFASIPVIGSGEVTVEVTGNPKDNQAPNNGFTGPAIIATIGQFNFIHLFVPGKYEGVKEYYYDGMPYYLPIIDGKATRVKGKMMTCDVEVIDTNTVEHGFFRGIHQYAVIKSIKKLAKK